MQPESVTPGLIWLVSENGPSKTILGAGAGGFEVSNVTLTKGIFVPASDDVAEQIEAQRDVLVARDGEAVPGKGFEQIAAELGKAGYKLSLG